MQISIATYGNGLSKKLYVCINYAEIHPKIASNIQTTAIQAPLVGLIFQLRLWLMQKLC
jgi:hypothetical protein